MAESCELAKKVKVELEKRLDEASAEKAKIEHSLKEKSVELEQLKAENEKTNAEQHSHTQVKFESNNYI